MKNLIILLALTTSFAHAQEYSLSKETSASLGFATVGSAATMASHHAIDKHAIDTKRFVTNATNVRTVIANFKQGDELHDLSKSFDVRPLNKILKDKSLSQIEMHNQLEKALKDKLVHHKYPIVLQKVTNNLSFLRVINKLGIVGTVAGIASLGSQVKKDSESKNRLNNTDRSIAIEKPDGTNMSKINLSKAKAL